MKIRSAGAQLLDVERQTDMMKLTVAFRNFTNAPKNQFTSTNHVTSTCKLLLNPEYTNYLLVMSEGDIISYHNCLKNVAAKEGFPVHFHASFSLQTCMSCSKWCPSSHTVTNVGYRQPTVAKIPHLPCLLTELGANNVQWQWQKQWHATRLPVQANSVCHNSKHGSTTHRKQPHFPQKKCILVTSL